MYKLKTNDLEKLFSQLNISYKRIDLKDDDLNYVIQFNPGNLTATIGVVEILLFYSYEVRKLIALCPNIYKLKKGDSTLGMLAILNNVNGRLTNGKVILNNDYVSWKWAEELSDVSLITKEKMKNMLNDFIAAVLYTSEEVERIRKNEK